MNLLFRGDVMRLHVTARHARGIYWTGNLKLVTFRLIELSQNLTNGERTIVSKSLIKKREKDKTPRIS